MAIVSNNYTSNNPDIDVKDRTTTDGKRIQAAYIDIGAGSAESPVTAANPLPVTAAISGTPDLNVAEYGGTATTLGQKAEAASVPVVLATEQDAVATDGTLGTFTKIGVPWYESGGPSEGWKPWPVVGDGQAVGKPLGSVEGWGDKGSYFGDDGEMWGETSASMLTLLSAKFLGFRFYLEEIAGVGVSVQVDAMRLIIYYDLPRRHSLLGCGR